MSKLVKKFIAVFFLAAFFLASGTGQIIHGSFHDHNHNYTVEPGKGSSSVNIPHTYCIAILLTLPEFFKSLNCVSPDISISRDIFFADFETIIPHLFSFKNSDRAPPVLA